MHSALLIRDALAFLGRELSAMGAQNYVLQEFRQQGCDQLLPLTEPTYLHCGTVERMSRQFRRFSVRGVEPGLPDISASGGIETGVHIGDFFGNNEADC